MQIIKTGDLPPEPVSHGTGISKQVIIKNGVVANLTQLSRTILEPGQSTTAHTHSDMTEIYAILEGQVKFTVDGKSYSAYEHSTVVIMPGELHAVKNESAKDAVFLYAGILSTGCK